LSGGRADDVATRRLDGKVALVTGAGSGIGRATAELFARSGARVAIADRDESAAAEAVGSVVAAGGVAVALRVDVSDAAQVAAAVERTLTEYGAIDVLVNNAGIGIAGDVISTTPADLDRVLAVNVRGVFNGCRAAIPRMLDRGGGVIVNVASAAALSAVPERAAYIASKGAVIALTKAIAVDFMARGIRCNCVAPGTIDSPWVERITAGYSDPAAARQRMVERQPIGRLGRPDEVAQAILYLASPEADFVHGTCLVIDGGMTAR
jgi:meso-butanediol dehydrogenase / (S,S)-butanediol dehydrogenase / diacetyl reductase